MSNNEQSFEANKFMAVVRGQLLVAGGNGFDFTQAEVQAALEKQSDIILAAHNAELLSVLEGLKANGTPRDERGFQLGGGLPPFVSLADIDQAIAKVKETSTRD